MTSEQPSEAYVWVWLPEAEQPVVAGRLDDIGGEISFVYGRSYLDRPDAVALYEPELPLVEERIRPLPGLDAPGCILDSSPDAWGRRVVLNRLLASGRHTAPDDPAEIGLLTLLLESGPDRIGALDFHSSPYEYEPGPTPAATLEELATSAERIESGVPLSPDLDASLMRGSSIGGARPKALLDDPPRQLIAKFSSTTDTFPVVQAECMAMELARRAGLSVAPVEMMEALGRKALLVERFDRIPGSSTRRMLVSALTILELNELAARYASYADLAEAIRIRFTDAAETLEELFARITFNILVGNTDDHARNHSAFWDGKALTLAPAYDICPQLRSGGRATQAMVIGERADGFKEGQVAGCIERSYLFHLTEAQAGEIVDRQIDVIESEWSDVCDRAALTHSERDYFWRRQFLNPYALEDYRRMGA